MHQPMNLPNKLTLLRIILVPFFMFFLLVPLLPTTWSRIIGASIFVLAAFTDMLDGMLARKYNLVTDFGKFMDPVADKCMVYGALLAILVTFPEFQMIFVWVVAIVIFRDLAVNSMRMVASNKEGTVIAAKYLGKLKTVSQIFCVVIILLEPVLVPQTWKIYDLHLFSYAMMAIMTILSVWSGLDYLKTYWNILDTTK